MHTHEFRYAGSRFSKMLLPPFHSKRIVEPGPGTGMVWCRKGSYKSSSFGKTQQCIKINRRVLIITTSAVAIFHGQCFDLLSVTNKGT